MKGFFEKILLVALLFVSTTPSFVASGVVAQSSSTPPAWTKNTPVKKGVYSSVVCVPKCEVSESADETNRVSIFSIESITPVSNYADSAKVKAFRKLIQILPWGIDKQSLLFTLGKSGIVVSSDDIECSLVNLMLDAPEFVLKGAWEDDDNYWCYYSINDNDFKFFLDRSLQSLCGKARNLYQKGLQYREWGNPKQAAACFVEALNTFQPLMFRCYNTGFDGKEELGSAILSALLSVYDGMKLESEFMSVPAVFGEALPMKIKVKVTQNDVPLKGIVLYTRFQGESDSSQTTDSLGIYTVSVNKIVSDEPVQKIHFYIDDDVLFDVGSSVADKLFKNHKFPETDVELKLFDPTPYVHVEMVPYDSVVVKAVSDQVVASGKDYKLTDSMENADLVVKIRQSTSVAGNFSNEKYSVTTYVGSLLINVESVSSGETLNTYSIADYRYAAKGERTIKRAAQSIARRFALIIEDDFPSFWKSVKFDKRGQVWQDYQ